MENRTAQDLLAERRSCVMEMRNEAFPEARKMLYHRIATLDRQLEAIRTKRLPQLWANPAANGGES
ncbi:hypothetical protein LCGC14_2503140 [marine sediment metagenome]|uniref:Uncharacterized protein n=1 Tax=marine sediment metagenome TaxID=412755 RepID=A0A0F9DD17_9ZZZZ